MPQRNTLQRQLVLQAVQALHSHPTAEDVYTEVSRQHPSISRATVYRNLNALAQQGEVRRVSHLNAADRFDFSLHPHYHFRCTRCGRVYDADLPYQEGLLDAVPNAAGHHIGTAEITFTGICAACESETNNEHNGGNGPCPS